MNTPDSLKYLLLGSYPQRQGFMSYIIKPKRFKIDPEVTKLFHF